MSQLTAFFWRKLKNLGKSLVYRDKRIFYGSHYGALDYLRLAILNMVYPGRILTRIRFKRFPIRNPAVSVPDDSIVVKPFEVASDDLVDLTVRMMRRHGAAVVDGFFSEDYLDTFRKERSNFFPPSPAYGSTDEVSTVWKGEMMSLDIQDLWMHEFIVKVIQGYIGRLPYARNYPLVQEMRPRRRTTSRTRINAATGFADSWHVDHSCLIQAAVFFDDVVLDGSHMEVLSGTNRMPCSADTLSDEYVDKSRWASRIRPCIGRKGSIQFHCGSVYHRFNAMPLSSRCWLKFEFTSGPNILLSPHGIASLLKSSSNYEDLTPDRKEILRGLIPPQIRKGYEPCRGGFTPTRFKGI